MSGPPPSAALQMGVLGGLLALIVFGFAVPSAGPWVVAGLVALTLALALWPTDNQGPWG